MSVKRWSYGALVRIVNPHDFDDGEVGEVVDQHAGDVRVLVNGVIRQVWHDDLEPVSPGDEPRGAMS